MKPPDPIDSALCEPLVHRATAGDVEAWTALVGHVWPASLRIVKSKMRGASTDHVQNVVTNLLGKLGDDEARGLKLYAPWREKNPGKTFADWYRIALVNTVRDYVRDHQEELAENEDLSATRLLNQFTRSGAAEEIGERPAVTAAQTARQLREYAARHLPEDQHRALSLWVDGATFEEIAAELGLGEPEAAHKLARAAIATLRRQFLERG